MRERQNYMIIDVLKKTEAGNESVSQVHSVLHSLHSIFWLLSPPALSMLTNDQVLFSRFSPRGWAKFCLLAGITRIFPFQHFGCNGAICQKQFMYKMNTLCNNFWHLTYLEESFCNNFRISEIIGFISRSRLYCLSQVRKSKSGQQNQRVSIHKGGYIARISCSLTNILQRVYEL